MKKITKSLVLSFAALLGLVSCGAPEITEEQARVRAQAISQEQEKESFELPKKFYLEEKVKTSMSSTTNGKTEKANANSNALVSLDLENLTFYMEANVSDGEESTSTKTWGYVENNTFVLASDLNGQKSYISTTIEINDFNFAAAIGDTINDIYDTITGSEYLDIDSYKNVSNDLANQLGISFKDPTVKFTSTGDGNLGISQTASLDMNVELGGTKITAKGSTKTSINFDNYFLSSAQMNLKLDMSDSSNKVSATVSNTLKVHMNSAKFSKPNLSSFTKAE